MKRHRNHVLEDLSLAELQKALPPMWVIHPYHRDYGIDVQVELFDENGDSTGLRIYGQLKATDKREDDDVLELDREHFEYWAAHTDPVALFRYFAGSAAIKWCWMHDLEWHMRPSAKSLDVSSHLIPWKGAESASAIIRLTKLRAESLRQRLTPPVSISVRNANGGLAYAGLQVLPPFIGWHVPYVSDEARQQILETWRSRIRSVADATPLQFPSLADYDDKLYPLTADSNAV